MVDATSKKSVFGHATRITLLVPNILHAMITMALSRYGLRSLSSTIWNQNCSIRVTTTIYPIQQVKQYPFHSQRTLRLTSTTTTVATPTTQQQSTINPPTSTLPAPLTLPTRTASQPALKYYFYLGRAYFTFYKTGAKAVYTNYRSSRNIISRLPASTPPSDALANGLLSRAEWQLIRRSRQDIKKAPLFALIFMVCGEFTPLVVMFMSAVVPRTCKAPQQVLKTREKAEMRRSNSFRDGSTWADDANEVNARTSISNLQPSQIAHIGRSLGLYSSVWDRLGFVPKLMVKRRIANWKRYIDMDDAAITKSGDLPLMEAEEMRIACEERGLDVLGKNEKQLMNELRAWLRARKRMDVTRLLLARPSVWAQ